MSRGRVVDDQHGVVEPGGGVPLGSPPGPAWSRAPRSAVRHPRGGTTRRPSRGPGTAHPTAPGPAPSGCRIVLADDRHRRGLLHDVAAVKPLRVVPTGPAPRTTPAARQVPGDPAGHVLPGHGRGDARTTVTAGPPPQPRVPGAADARRPRRTSSAGGAARHLEALGHSVQPLDQVGLVELMRPLLPRSGHRTQRPAHGAARPGRRWSGS